MVFDLGFLLALLRMGWPDLSPEALLEPIATPIDRTELDWYVSLGLLRLLYRTQTLDLPSAVRSAAGQRLRHALLGRRSAGRTTEESN